MMVTSSENLYPDFEGFLKRQDKESLLNQKGKSLWLTGLSGSGKTTLAVALEKKLHDAKILVKVFDGDIVRATINQDADFSEEGRRQHIEKIAHISKAFVDCGIVVINCFISPKASMREAAKNIIGQSDFIEVFLSCPLGICEKRDPKGLYAKARRGDIKNFTGIDSPYEAPETPAKIIDTAAMSVEDAATELFNFVLPQIKPKAL